MIGRVPIRTIDPGTDEIMILNHSLQQPRAPTCTNAVIPLKQRTLPPEFEAYEICSGLRAFMPVDGRSELANYGSSPLPPSNRPPVRARRRRSAFKNHAQRNKESMHLEYCDRTSDSALGYT